MNDDMKSWSLNVCICIEILFLNDTWIRLYKHSAAQRKFIIKNLKVKL